MKKVNSASGCLRPAPCKGHHRNLCWRLGRWAERARLVETLLSTESQNSVFDQDSRHRGIRSAFPGKRAIMSQRVTLKKSHGILFGSILCKLLFFAILMVTFTLVKIYTVSPGTLARPPKGYSSQTK